ncbi:MAG: transporter substrate-binding domain-containing protein [Planctomycetes bacterium]|nr:transporter substrate-binding domain-containing protein [Planctomycetota bacterium]
MRVHGLIFAALCATAMAQVPLPQRYQDIGVLRFGADAEGGAPFVYVDAAHPERGEIGFEVDLARELGRVFGVRMERVQSQYENLVPALERNNFDIVLNGFEPTKARCAQVRFTRPYYIFQLQLTVNTATTGIAGLLDLTGKRVTVLGQSQGHQVVLAAPGLEAVVHESNVTAYQDVVNGHATASLADLPIARALRPMFPGLTDVGAPFGEYFYAIAVRRTEPELQAALDAAIAQLLHDGTLERIYRKWDLWVPAEAALDEARVALMFAEVSTGAESVKWGPSITLLLHGALRTVGISVLAFACALVLGLALAMCRLYGNRPLRVIALCYIELLRGTPVLVQMLLLYYGLGQLECLRSVPAWCFGVVGLALNYAAYEAEIYRAALTSIPRAQSEAAFALGLSPMQTVRHVIFPQALRLSLAPSTNDFIALFKDSSIVMVITVVELTKQYQMLANATGRFLLLGLVTSGIYLAMSLPLAIAARRFERALNKDAA